MTLEWYIGKSHKFNFPINIALINTLSCYLQVNSRFMYTNRSPSSSLLLASGAPDFSFLDRKFSMPLSFLDVLSKSQHVFWIIKNLLRDTKGRSSSIGNCLSKEFIRVKTEHCCSTNSPRICSVQTPP